MKSFEAIRKFVRHTESQGEEFVEKRRLVQYLIDDEEQLHSVNV